MSRVSDALEHLRAEKAWDGIVPEPALSGRINAAIGVQDRFLFKNGITISIFNIS